MSDKLILPDTGVENIYEAEREVGLTGAVSVPRREFLARLAALGATTLMPGAAAFAAGGVAGVVASFV